MDAVAELEPTLAWVKLPIMESTTSERRRQPRAPLITDGEIDFGDHRAPCRVVDVSRTGLAVITEARRPPMRVIRVRFRIGGADASWAEIDATVVRAEPADEAGVNALWGMEFQPMEPGTRIKLRSYVTAELRN